MTNLTAKERKLIEAWPVAYEDWADAASDLGSTWADAEELALVSGMKLASVKGLLGSLAAKGYVTTAPKANGEPGSDQCLTEALCQLMAGAEPAATEEPEAEPATEEEAPAKASLSAVAAAWEGTQKEFYNAHRDNIRAARRAWRSTRTERMR